MSSILLLALEFLANLNNVTLCKKTKGYDGKM